MSQLNLNELYNTINEKTLKRMEVYDSILQKCHHRIKYNSKLEKTYCFYQIPTFIFGTPIYNIDDMISYVKNSLTKNGFQIMTIEPNWLFIRWDMSGKKILIEITLMILLMIIKKMKKLIFFHLILIAMIIGF
jgi:hypothetical protein